MKMGFRMDQNRHKVQQRIIYQMHPTYKLLLICYYFKSNSILFLTNTLLIQSIFDTNNVRKFETIFKSDNRKLILL